LQLLPSQTVEKGFFMPHGAIGGYFQLELPQGRENLPKRALKFHCARAAFRALLQSYCPDKVWLPHYICESMEQQVSDLGIDLHFYGIDETLFVGHEVDLGPRDLLVFVNYFGVGRHHVSEVLKRFNPHQIVMDFSQSFFMEPQECLATIYSPRKFFGVPDGGFICSELEISQPTLEDEDSVARTAHLIKRLGGAPESGYLDYQRAEHGLSGTPVKKMSELTSSLLASIDMQTARARRNMNFEVLHTAFGQYNELSIDVTVVDGPLCYPFLTEKNGVRESLIAERIYVPTYWPEVTKRANVPNFERFLTTNLVPIPCDQRYGIEEMMRIVQLIDQLFEKHQ
jgi:hypothetical protein